ncbi:hypothetical protein E2C01_083619 [Portunus trituberculatus]|uniref:Uncharacterized protein n=1 Tax=Portunus trituberculatus TaxID=210409 RepID=A0A5B7IVN1_PORTR|nr:hypothetical protein [Portunus trituberculatus]
MHAQGHRQGSLGHGLGSAREELKVGIEGSQLLVSTERVVRGYDFCNQDWVIYGLALHDLSGRPCQYFLSHSAGSQRTSTLKIMPASSDRTRKAGI